MDTDILVRQNAVEKLDNPNQIDSGCETSTTKSTEEILLTTTIVTEEICTDNNDVLVLRTTPESNRRIINKSAYAKLHRSLSPTRQLDYIKSRYETNDIEINKSDTEKSKLHRNSAIKLNKQEADSTRIKSKLPLPKSKATIKNENKLPVQKGVEKSKYRHSLILDRKSKKKDENSNEVFRKSSSSSGEFITIVPRSESIETVDKLEHELSLFTMDKKPKDKKRANSFRKIFTGKIFSKEKKKKDDTEQQRKTVNIDNIQNENNAFSRQFPYRHSMGNTNIPKPTKIPQIEEKHQQPINIEEIEKKYAQMHVKEFNNIKHNFENPKSPETPDKPVQTVNPGPMDFKKVANINKFIDTSSSASTMESDRENSIKQFNQDTENPYRSLRFADNQRNTPPRAQELRQIQDVKLVNPKALIPINSERPLPNPYQNIASSKPKVSPKPQLTRTAHHSPSPKPNNTTHFNYPEQEPKPVFDETYGTVFDSLELKKEVPVQKIILKPPRSPSLEPTKLKLPPNRDVGPMSPRMKSPIPQHHVSAEKLIATELLRSSRSPTPTKKRPNQLVSNQQRQETNIDFSDNESMRPILSTKPPISRMPEHVSRITSLSSNYENKNYRSTEYINIPRQQMTTFVGSHEKLSASKIPEQIQRTPNHENKLQLAGSQGKISPRIPQHLNVQRYSQVSPIYGSQERMSRSRTPDHINIQNHAQISPHYDIKINADCHERSLNSTRRSPTPNILLQNTELSTVRPQSSRSSTPVDLRIPPQSNKQSPQKEEMRRSVEAYYWKEIKKLKELENRDLYYYQVQYMPFGYSEEPISIRKSRSSSPSQRNGRRSLSLPREQKSHVQQTTEVDGYGRFQPMPIPEGRAVVNYSNYYNQNLRRNAPERRTIDAVPRNGSNSMNRPIFKRGSLTAPVREVIEDQQYKKVSFGNRQDEDAWPTRNGYTQYPPQRPKRVESTDDDVFLPNSQQTTKLIVDGKEIYGYTNRPYDNLVVRQQESPYYQNANFYRQIHQELPPSEDPRSMPRYNTTQLAEPTYIQHQRVSRRMSFDNVQPQRRQIYVKDDVYGYFGGYVPGDQQNVVYASRQNIDESLYGYSRGVPKQITVRDKVCDMYGQIHDRNSPSLNVKKSGVILGQVQQLQNSSYSPLPNQNFVRNSRLTASANDMYRRYQNGDPRYTNNVIYDIAPSRPLPPVPTEKKVHVRHNMDNGAEINDLGINNSAGKTKKRAVFGK
ncbi:uncharacterized protein LOC130451309 [Diorhabda sublineata]|uniref:uncharacterized protein LOC130451309 n=1 Tax=Diorhabda sublineata TaxID=1163346 RepID=UPI0024E0A3D3|nr:uncharacterized protein LOC130451309 [Diorhabda sublineata]XP_056646229.1 uncharacterized protein LOC130451309 [Diorhabda sublineata]XP_056646230.1 uncharacterized protein LOC130451309 [Diorhabda sublineata]XP_056646231.1 uncharacterized protein LOC130451309 [Diorhabda sublineata]